MTPQKSVGDLVTRIKAMLGAGEHGADIDAPPLRYVLYARKSTDVSEKQERSIPDQIAVCMELANRLGLFVVHPPLHEERSSKMADNRPIFRSMLDDLTKHKKYDAILTWAPDRLARNMKEAGEIIDLLDKGDIKDIKFASGYYFQNDAMGKMMLGIAFVQAKQFSDQHSQNVKRSIVRIANEGKLFSHTKHGYYRDAKKYPHPDGENWELIKRAFEMRLEERLPLKEIARWLVEQGYPRKTKHNPKPTKTRVTDNLLSNLFRDPFYAGAYVHGGQVVNLLDHFPFQPIITPEQFETLAKENGINKEFSLTESIKPKGSVKAKLMRRMIVCGACRRNMSTGLTSKKTNDGIKHHYFYYRCDTDGCRYKGKSIRAKAILEAAFAYLDAHPMLNFKKGYAHYLKETDRERRKREAAELKAQQALVQRHKAAKRKMEDLKDLFQLHKKDRSLVALYRDDLKKQKRELDELTLELSYLQQSRSRSSETIATYEQFIELMQNLAQQIKKIGSMEDLDFIMQKVFSNFTIEGRKVTKITQNSPFRELCDSQFSMDSQKSVLVGPPGIEPGTTEV